MVLKGLIQDSMEQGVTKAYPTPPLSVHYFLLPGQSTPRESYFEESLTVPSALQRSSRPIVLFHSTANCVGSLSLRKELPSNARGVQNPNMV